MSDTFLDLARETPDDGTFDARFVRASFASTASTFDGASAQDIYAALYPPN